MRGEELADQGAQGQNPRAKDADILMRDRTSRTMHGGAGDEVSRAREANFSFILRVRSMCFRVHRDLVALKSGDRNEEADLLHASSSPQLPIHLRSYL